jgi:hypothetical protein
MSRLDLEQYWNGRDSYFRTLGVSMHDLTGNSDALGKFLEHKTAADARLRSQDMRAWRALIYSAQMLVAETKHIVNELYPDEDLKPKNVELDICTNGQRELCLQIYDALTALALGAANELAPL